MLEIGVESSLLDDIALGTKTADARLGKPKYVDIREGDQIRLREDVWESGTIVDSSETDIYIIVRQILYFESFAEMFQSINHETVVPYASNAEEAIETLRQFHSQSDEEKYGVVALMFEIDEN